MNVMSEEFILKIILSNWIISKIRLADKKEQQ